MGNCDRSAFYIVIEITDFITACFIEMSEVYRFHNCTLCSGIKIHITYLFYSVIGSVDLISSMESTNYISECFTVFHN